MAMLSQCSFDLFVLFVLIFSCVDAARRRVVFQATCAETRCSCPCALQHRDDKSALTRRHFNLVVFTMVLIFLQVSPEQDHLLKNAFSLLDFDGDGKLGEDEFRTLLR